MQILRYIKKSIGRVSTRHQSVRVSDKYPTRVHFLNRSTDAIWHKIISIKHIRL